MSIRCRDGGREESSADAAWTKRDRITGGLVVVGPRSAARRACADCATEPSLPLAARPLAEALRSAQGTRRKKRSTKSAHRETRVQYKTKVPQASRARDAVELARWHARRTVVQASAHMFASRRRRPTCD
jgi:multidrug resistance efflux pump